MLHCRSFTQHDLCGNLEWVCCILTSLCWVYIIQDILLYFKIYIIILRQRKYWEKNLIIKSLLVTAIQALNFLILFIKTLNTITWAMSETVLRTNLLPSRLFFVWSFSPPNHSFTIRYRMSEKFYLNEKHSPTHLPSVATAHCGYLQYETPVPTTYFLSCLVLVSWTFIFFSQLYSKLLEGRDDVISCLCSFP